MIYLDFCLKTNIASNDLILTLLEKANHPDPFSLGHILHYVQRDPGSAQLKQHRSPTYSCSTAGEPGSCAQEPAAQEQHFVSVQPHPLQGLQGYNSVSAAHHSWTASYTNAGGGWKTGATCCWRFDKIVILLSKIAFDLSVVTSNTW